VSSPRDAGAAFAAALLDPSRPAPQGLIAWHGGATDRRFAVYRNNVLSGLVEALAKRFPVCAQLVGEEFFRAMARVYVRSAPPAAPMLSEYGGSFADFIARFEPAQCLPWLSDVARLEFALGCAYRAADAEAITLEALADLAPETLGERRLQLHPALRLIPSRFPIVSIWRAHVAGAPLSDIDLSRGEDALAVRPDLLVNAEILPSGAGAFIAALQNGATLAEAAALGAQAAVDFDLAQGLVALFANGGVVAIDPAA
jgi:hypothetical protein